MVLTRLTMFGLYAVDCITGYLRLQVDSESVSGVRKLTSNWDGEMGSLDYDGVQVDIPNALARLSSNHDPRKYDLSELGPGLDVVDETRTIMN